MRIRMKSTQRGAEDGVTVREYVAGAEYALGGTPRADELAAVFIREGWAVEVKPSPAPAAAPTPEPTPPDPTDSQPSITTTTAAPPPPPGPPPPPPPPAPRASAPPVRPGKANKSSKPGQRG